MQMPEGILANLALKFSRAFLHRHSLASNLVDLIDILIGSREIHSFNTFHFVSLNIQSVYHRTQKSKENTDNKLRDVRIHAQYNKV